MNDGILTGIVMLIGLVLLASGWKDVLLPEVRTRTLAAVAACAAVFAPLHLTVEGIRMGGPGIFALLLALWALAGGQDGWGGCVRMAVPALLIACLVYLLRLYLTLEPMWAIWGGRLDPALAAALLSVGWAGKPALVQVGALSGALAVSDLAAAVHTGAGASFGGAAFADAWLAAVCVSRVGCALALRAAGVCRKLRTRWNKRFGQPDGHV